jgi:diacylglycerol kinase (ATP)
MSLVGEEGVPIQVDGEAWVQPPGMIRIIHKNRMQMLCRNKVRMDSLVLFTVLCVDGFFLKIRC